MKISDTQNILNEIKKNHRDKISELERKNKSGELSKKYLDKDIGWDEFQQHITCNKYNGIFIQEPVIGWNVPLYQRPQHIATALGRLGFLVIYKTGNWAGDDVNGFREVENNVWLTDKWEPSTLSGAVRSYYSTAYANTSDHAIKFENSQKIIYEYIDHIDPEISGDEENIKKLISLKNYAFSGGADFIVSSAQKLYEESVELAGLDKTILVPNGVDTRHYNNAKHLEYNLPESVKKFKNKYKYIIGYFGAIAPWLWYEMISSLVSARPDIGFIFIGPDYYGGVEKLPQSENMLYLGTINYSVLPAYGKIFDICFIPFKPGEIAKTTSPLKLFEYFALKKPVVVTHEMHECTIYPEVFSGDSLDKIIDAINMAIIVKDNELYIKRLEALALENDWDERAKKIGKTFDV
jgi:hypothetical protein